MFVEDGMVCVSVDVWLELYVCDVLVGVFVMFDV